MILLPWNQRSILSIASHFLRGEAVVTPTDTIYGILARATDSEAVKSVYELKRRNPSKPFIILISSLEDLNLFDIHISEQQKNILNKYWPGKVSVILSCESSEYEYLHRGTKTLAFRYPKEEKLLELIKISGPLIAPSANPEGLEPAKNTEEALVYFGESLTYVDDGNKVGAPSTLISLVDDKLTILRGTLPSE